MPKASDFRPSKLFSLGDDNEPEKGIPVRMAGTWTDTVQTQPGQKSQRGFGGRIMFYDKHEEKPILVEGQLVVYAFDETNRSVTDNKPTRRYVFPPDQVALRMSKSELGASYSFWLPWDEAGGPQTEVSLICRFEPKGGAVVTSEQTRHRLPGTITAPAVAADGRPLPPKLPEGVPSRPAQPTLESLQENRMRDHNLQMASYESMAPAGASTIAAENVATAAPLEPVRRMTTTSIPLPANFQLPTASAVASPMPAQNVGMPQQQAPMQMQPMPTPAQQPAANLTAPIYQQMPAAMNRTPGAAPPVQNPRLGSFPVQMPGTPTVATPTVYSPTSNGFGFGFAAASQQPLGTQPAAPQVARLANARMVPWNNVQTTTVQNMPANMLQQPQANGATQQPQTVVQAASQPLPPPTGLTTTVSYPSPATALR
jgi:hypothetical protein